MKRILLSLMAIMMGGCGYISFNPNPNPVSASNSCPEKPTSTLDPKDVTPISLNTTEYTKVTGQLNAGKSKGYSFEAEADQNLKYRSKETICFWIYSPKSELLPTQKLTQKGKYIVEVSIAKGSIDPELEMTLGNPESISSPTPSASIASSTPATSASVSSSPETPSSSKTISPPPTATGLSEKEAVQIVQNWLNAKKRIFASPYDEQLVANLNTGERYTKTLGSIKWLKENNAYYQYKMSEVRTSSNFSSSSNQARIEVNVLEDLTLYVNGRVDDQNTSFGAKPINKRFYFKLERGAWRIENDETL